MTGCNPRFGSINISFTPALVLYATAWFGSLITVFILGPLFGLGTETWAEYYHTLGELLRIWGVIFGFAFLLVSFYLTIRGTVRASIRSFVVRLTFIEQILLITFIANIAWGLIGVLRGYPASFIAGDTIRGMFIPIIYWIVKVSVETPQKAISLMKIILIGETILLFILVPTGFIPFSFAGRTFLTTVFFTLLFEELHKGRRFGYAILLLIGIFVVLTTQAQRGIIIIFITIIILNYFFRLREIKFSLLFFAFLLPTIVMFSLNTFFDLGLEKEVNVAAQRFSGTVIKSEGNKYFGFDQSIFQRIGETIDVGRSFTESHPVFFFTGFGNGAILINKLITPSERSVYKTNRKHSLYITPVALLFRNGLLGLGLYLSLLYYFVKNLFRLKANRSSLREYRNAVYLKLLLLYQLSVIILSLIVYWYIGNIIVAFTIPIIEILRRDVEERSFAVRTNLSEERGK